MPIDAMTIALRQLAKMRACPSVGLITRLYAIEANTSFCLFNLFFL